MDVSDRRMQVQLTPEAKIASDFIFIRAIFAVVGFVSALAPSQGDGKGPCRSPLQRAYVAVAAEKQADGHAREGEDQKQQRRARAAARTQQAGEGGSRDPARPSAACRRPSTSQPPSR